MSNEVTRNIREFIYVDIPRLYSLYSQVFQGVADKIIRERTRQIITGDTRSPLFQQNKAESEELEAQRRTESGLLHDHLYNRLEEALTPALQSADDISPSQLVEVFEHTPIVKVRGPAEVEDYERLQVLTTHYNQLAGTIAHSFLISEPERQEKLAGLRRELAELPGNQPHSKKRRLLLSEISALEDSRAEAERRGLAQSEVILENVKFWASLFNPEGYEVLIVPSGRSDVQYRGVLDRSWLRNDPALIRNLYGNQSETPWTMVGVVTHIPGTYVARTPPTMPNSISHIDADNPSMLEAFRAVLRSTRTFERLLLESEHISEVIVAPIAIYKEFSLQLSNTTIDTSE